jgi:hypothetical protein
MRTKSGTGRALTMETFRPCALFHADFPDDHIEDDDRIIQFWGRGVTEALAEIAAGPGRTVSAPQHEHEHGWTFDVVADNARVWFQVSNMEDDVFLLISKGYRRNHAALHLEVLNAIQAALSQDARFRQLKWYQQKELFAGFVGAENPLEPEVYAFEDPLPSSSPVSVYSLRHILLMARIRPWAHFEVDFPDEVSDGEYGSWNFGKRPAVSAMEAAFERLGYFSTRPIPKGRHQWSLYVYKGGRRVEFRFKFKGSAGRVFCAKPSLVGRYWFWDDEKYIAAIADLDAEMRRDPRFRDMRWQFHGWPGLKTPGADSPFSETPGLGRGRAA